MNEPLNQPAQASITSERETTQPYSKPKRLIEHATEDPLYVIKGVFEYERLSFIKDYCRDWFHVALINEGVYMEEEERAGLVSFYEALMPLLEALYIIYKKHKPEKPEHDWSNLPQEVVETLTNDNKIVLLSKEQAENPMQVVTCFCQQFTIEYTERELWQWLEAGITYGGKYPESINEATLVMLYDYIHCLTSAAYELARREAAKPLPGALVEGDKTSVLEKIITVVTETCNPEKIFLLHSAPSEYDASIAECNILVLLPGSPTARPNKEYQSQIDAKCKGWASVLLTFNTTKEVYRYLQTGHLFYSAVCKPDKLVYDYNKQPLPEISSFNIRDIIQNTRNLYAAENKKAGDFLEIARYCHATRKFNCAAFLLHQAAERILIGFLFSLTGHSYFTHNLFTLLQKTKSFTNGLAAALPQHPEKEKNLLVQLNKAYTHTRYRNDYKINNEQVATLLKKVQALKKAAAQAVEEQLIGFEKLFQS